MTTSKIERESQAIDLEVGARLRDRRKAQGLNQTELGQALGVSFQQIQKYERGTNRISSSALVLLARALNCEPADLLGANLSRKPLGEQADPLRAFLGAAYGPDVLRAFPRLTADRQRLALQVIQGLGEAA